MSSAKVIAAAAVKDEKKKTICGGCGSELEPDQLGIQCVQGHHFCTECSTHIVDLFFANPQKYIPLRCLQCHIELNPCVFERQLTLKQHDIYDQYMLTFVRTKESPRSDERLDHCPFCSWGSICSKQASHTFYCERPECHVVSCLTCLKACPRVKSDYPTDEELAEIEQHFICAELADDKQIVDDYLELGQKVPCPQCGLAGRKDHGCTHMACPTCAQLWCYFCGKKVEDCDKVRGGTNGIYDHNVDWNCNPNRCPMYLRQIAGVDDRWSNNEEDCLVRFHRIRTLRLLREAFEKLGQNRMDELDRHFSIISSSDFTWNEILHGDLTLIRYTNSNRTRNDS
ncbi:unnamed protein product [Rotaria sordida]|uniref:RING-type domain-containing protein n=1 Tax=Rotaria sordida TaxID=392033 RepID=A0A818VVE2_9BILA|nr:unnamed protein product [Rotaria sordida]CAF3716690.1 unnamed protein product [Rotaria sordida]